MPETVFSSVHNLQDVLQLSAAFHSISASFFLLYVMAAFSSAEQHVAAAIEIHNRGCSLSD